MNVIIVDDEYFAGAALEKLVHDYFNEIGLPLSCQLFDNPVNALEYLNGNAVDLVMTDIRMSELDGLSLALTIQGMNRDIETVVISGYADFTYAQTALKYEVVDYLLKPISRKQVYDCLEKRVRHYRQKCEKTQETAEREKHSLFRQITANSGYTAESLLDDIDEKERYSRAVMVMLSASQGPVRAGQEKVEGLKRLNGTLAFDFKEPDSMCILLVYFAGSEEKGGISERLAAHCNMYYKHNFRKEKILISISLAVPVETPLYQLYKQCVYALGGRLLCPDSYLFDYKKETSQKEYKRLSPLSLEHEIKQSFEFGDMELAKDIVDRQLNRAAGKEEGSVAMLSDVIAWLVIILNKAVYEDGRLRDVVENIPEVPLKQFGALDEIRVYFHQYIDKVNAQMKQPDSAENVADKMIQYIEDNYYRNISLAELSKNVLFLNQSYVSRLFKSRTGVSFSRYLLSYRLEKAMECILSNPKITVQEAASLNGFYDCSYFVKQFKKQFGETPGYYQKKGRN